MAPHSSTLALRIPWMEEPGGLQSMGSRRVRHDWATSLSLFTFMHWRRKWQPTPVFLPGESQGRWRLVGCRLWGRTESDTTERLSSNTVPHNQIFPSIWLKYNSPNRTTFPWPFHSGLILISYFPPSVLDMTEICSLLPNVISRTFNCHSHPTF